MSDQKGHPTESAKNFEDGHCQVEAISEELSFPSLLLVLFETSQRFFSAGFCVDSGLQENPPKSKHSHTFNRCVFFLLPGV